MMTPQKGDTEIRIPVTFDTKYSRKEFRAGSMVLIVGLYVVCLAVAILVWITADEESMKWKVPLGVFTLATVISRTIIVPEHYFMGKRDRLTKHNYKFPYSLIWNAFDIVDASIPVLVYPRGYKGVCVHLDKDIVIGKGENARYDHNTALATAYDALKRRGFFWYHVDYMDIVGKDDRLDWLQERVSVADNPELRKLLTIMLTDVRFCMDKSYASYDSYILITKGDIDDVVARVCEVMQYFNSANYIRLKFLNRYGVRDLIKIVYGIEDFSTTEASESFAGKHETIKKFITPIYVEKDGVRTKLNKTKEEREEEQKVREQEESAKRSNKNLSSKQKKEDTGMDLFD